MIFEEPAMGLFQKYMDEKERGVFDVSATAVPALPWFFCYEGF